MNRKKEFNLESFFLSNEQESGDMIQLITSDEDDGLDESIPEVIPVLPIKNTVLFPGVVIPITVGRTKSIKLVKKAYRGDRIIGVVAQQNNKAEDPNLEDMFQVGTVAKILKLLVLPDGNTTIIIQGRKRFRIEQLMEEEPFLTAKIQLLDERFPERGNKKILAIIKSLKESASRILKLNPEIPQEAQVALDNIDNPAFLTHFLSSNISAEVKDKQRLLEINDGVKRATVLLDYMNQDIQMLELKQEIQNKVHSDIDQQQRDYYLRQQIKVLQDELGYAGPDQELNTIKNRADRKKWPPLIQDHFYRELDKISRMNPMAAEYPVAMNYVEFLVDLPWSDFTKDNFDLQRAQKVLDRDHFGLEKVKDRILEYLAVLKLKQDMKSPILCLVGPPGVGKTSLGRSVAKALNRKYVRMSLGGVHDEAEIRGHRKTYVGAMPGKIIHNIKKVNSSNPVFILDEIDKISSDFRGDPSSALLEVLDPEQNSTFVDNYLEVEYDLSKVLFIATANTLDTIQPALLDRMEIIEISGYNLEEKIEIAKRHLIPKQRKENGINGSQVNIQKDALVKLIEGYTRESGVRSLERRIASIFRNVAKQIAMEKDHPKKINAQEVVKILGPEHFDKELYHRNEIPGVSIGLAYTQVGGEILFIEASLSRGSGKFTLSGHLGDVMKESAMAALSYLKSNADHLNIDYKIFDKYDLHIHVPAGAIPKDGPSAGITMLTALASVYTRRIVKNQLAMTGEITLRGKVLPVGGIKEKILAAKRAGIEELVMCEKNRKDVLEIKQDYLKNLKIRYVEDARQVLEIALSDERADDLPRYWELSEEKAS